MPGPSPFLDYTADHDEMDPVETRNDNVVTTPERTDYNTFARSVGLSSMSEIESQSLSIEAQLAAAGIDVENPQVQLLIQNYGDMLKDPTLAPGIIADLQQNYPAVPAQVYDQALAQSGFTGAFAPPLPATGSMPLGASGLTVADFAPKPPGYETNEDTGWIRYKNGVLVSPDGQVAFDPTSKAPGSIRWQREVVSKWGDEKVAEWKKRLHDMGYLTKEQMKVEGTDQVFLGALADYHTARYANGGKPVAGDLAGAGAAGSGAEKPPLMNFEDQVATIRNDVREQYRRIFGADPSDGEVTAWSDYIIKKGMDLQRKFRRKEYGNFTGMAATEVEERFIERLEGSPEAQYLQDQEENTTLHDALQQSVVVANSLA